MTIRITGMNSGLDVESIISELVKVQKGKVDKIKQEQTELEWKQEAWKELNTKLYNLWNDVVDGMTLSSAYSKKTTTASNSDLVSVITGQTAMNGTQELFIDKTSKTGFLTGVKLADGLTGDSKLSELGISYGSSIKVKVGGVEKTVDLSPDMSIRQLTSRLNDAGVNANFDAGNGRFFIGAKKSGADADFTLEFSDPNVEFKLGLNTAMNAADIQALRDSGNYTQADVDNEVARRTALLNQSNDELNAKKTELNEKIQKLIDERGYDPTKTVAQLKAELAAVDAPDSPLFEDEKIAARESLNKKIMVAEEAEGYKSQLDAAQQQLDINNNYLANGGQVLKDEVGQYFADKKIYANQIADQAAAGNLPSANHMAGRDAEITLNGAPYKSSTDTFEINGITYTVKGETNGQPITITTREDTDGIYDMVKNFITKYNEVINEMDKLYNAELAKGYKPLTDEEREKMTDKQAEKWEQKIKDQILRRDETISTVAGALKQIMMEEVNMGNGETMYLTDFGIDMQSYFLAPENQKNAYHIDGDPDDSVTKNKDDVLKGMIASDPETVTKFFTGLAKNLSGKMQKLMAGVKDYSSSFTFYADKKMKAEYEEYTEKIKKQEAKIKAMEDKYYKKFSVMETAMARMQSSQNAIAGLLGGGSM